MKEITAPSWRTPFRVPRDSHHDGQLHGPATASLIRIDVDRDGAPHSVSILRPLNHVRHVNRLLGMSNARLPLDGTLTGCVETSEQRKRRVLGVQPGLVARLRYALDYIAHRVAPKLSFTRSMYFALTGARDRVFSRAEILGRLAFAGFEVVHATERGGLFHFEARKRGEPVAGALPSQGVILRMDRVGKNGRVIQVFKIRTMHPYAEHLQAHVYEQNHLAANGKFGRDFRVTTVGRLLRRYWLDELPMVINLLKADLKLVGVRPISRHYLSLYPPDLVDWRLRHKPGLIPPFYADLPSGFEQILESERQYLARYERHPLRTDLSYLFKIVANIVLRGARSE